MVWLARVGLTTWVRNFEITRKTATHKKPPCVFGHNSTARKVR